MKPPQPLDIVLTDGSEPNVVRLKLKPRKRRLTYGTGELHKPIVTMSPKQFTAFRMDPSLLDAMRRVKAKEGPPVHANVDPPPTGHRV